MRHVMNVAGVLCFRMKMLWTVYILMAPFSVHAVTSGKELVCTNDFINNVSCLWNSSDVNPPGDCLIFAVKKVWTKSIPEQITQSCKLQRREKSVPGCSFVFQNREFSGSEVMPNISMLCNGKLVETIDKYKPSDHIKMHPPAAPNVSSTGENVHISWSLDGHVYKYFLEGFNFQVQIKENHQTWMEAKLLSTQQQEEMILVEKLKDFLQFRVRVNPVDRLGSQWSDWSPTTSWTRMDVPHEHEIYVDPRPLITTGVTVPLILMGVVIFVFYRRAKARGGLKGKPVPNPSEYFQAFSSVQDGNLKKWLNPHSAPDSFFTASADYVSTVVVCKARDVMPTPSNSPSCSSTSATLGLHSDPSVGSDGATSSSCFSNMGYFMSSSSGSSTQTSSPPPYFTCEKDIRPPESFILPSASACVSYERLRRGPHSPDSGFCIGNEDKMDTDVEIDQDFEDPSSPLIFPLHLQCLLGSSPSSLSLHHSFSPVECDTGIQQVDDLAAEGGCGSEVWPVSGAMCRSSSMPAEPSKTGYLTIKELHATFSNKSI